MFFCSLVIFLNCLYFGGGINRLCSNILPPPSLTDFFCGCTVCSVKWNRIGWVFYFFKSQIFYWVMGFLFFLISHGFLFWVADICDCVYFTCYLFCLSFLFTAKYLCSFSFVFVVDYKHRNKPFCEPNLLHGSRICCDWWSVDQCSYIRPYIRPDDVFSLHLWVCENTSGFSAVLTSVRLTHK